MIEIRLATTPHELTQIAQLRYAVYVEELGATMEYADHSSQELCEPWDATGENIGVWREGQLVGCVRFNSAETTDFSEYEELFHLAELKRHLPCSRKEFSLATKLAVMKRHRGLTLTTALCQAYYGVIRAHNASLNFLICQTNLVPFYQKFGFQICNASFVHQEGGSVTPMVLIVQDQEQLQRLQSPFLPLCKQYSNDQTPAMQFREFYQSMAAKLETATYRVQLGHEPGFRDLGRVAT